MFPLAPNKGAGRVAYPFNATRPAPFPYSLEVCGLAPPLQPLRLALGRQPAPPDPRTLRLATYTPDRPVGPKTADWMRTAGPWPLYRNDRVGDCTVVSCAHQIRAWARYATNTVVEVPEQAVLDTYTQVSGWDPRQPDSDTGAVLRDVLNRWRKDGIAGHKIVAYVAVDPRDHDEVRFALHLFGGLIAGLDLPLSAEAQVRRRETWRPVAGPAGRPNSWGGHAVHLGRHDSRFVTATTWGATQRMTWGFVDTYLSELYAVLSDDWLGAAGTSPSGLNLTQLLADLDRITAT